MKVFCKYGLLPVAVFLVLALVTVILAPVLVNVETFVPRLEEELSAATGRRVSLGGDLSLSFFPWLSLSFSDLQVGNPQGFGDGNFLQVRSFEARVKVLPLLRNRVEISRFVVGGLSLNLEKRVDGRGNWQGLLGQSQRPPAASLPGAWLGRLSRLSFSLLAITDGQVRWRDAASQQEQRVDDIMLLLNDFAPEKAVAVDAKAIVNGQAVAVEGKVGPLFAASPGKIALDLEVLVQNSLKGRFLGTLATAQDFPNLDGTYEFPGFSLRNVASAWGLLPPTEEAADTALGQASFQGGLRLDAHGLHLANGSGRLDDTSLQYSASLARPEGPATFTLHFDNLDLDRYLPMLRSASASQDTGLSRLIASMPNGIIGFGRLEYGALVFEELHLPLAVRERRLLIDGITGKIAGGAVSGEVTVTPGEPEGQVSARLALRHIDGAALVRQWLGKDGVRTVFDADLDLSWERRSTVPGPQRWRGEGDVRLGEGVIPGYDLGTALPLPAGGGAGGEQGAPPATPFSAGWGKIGLAGGVVQVHQATLTLANGELSVSGAIDLPQQRLELETVATTASVVAKRGREQRGIKHIAHSITGPIASPLVTARPDFAPRADSRQSAKLLVAETLPVPTGEGLGNLVGRDLVDPAVVAERFRLQPEVLTANEKKTKLPLGTGRIHLGELRQEDIPR